MKPARFQYIRPQSLVEALKSLEEYGEDGKIISGGQSLIPLLNMRLSTPKYLIDINHIQELSYIREEENYLAIGALTRHSDIENSPLVKEKCPLLIEAVKHVGHTHIRSRGTIGGSIAHADPSAELTCMLSLLRGEIVIANAEEERIAEPESFFLTYMLTDLQPDELITEIRFPFISEHAGYSFIEKVRRHGDFALVEAASVIELDDEGNISFARLAVGGASPVPCVLEELEDYLLGKTPSEELLEAVSAQVTDYLDPDADLHASSVYRQHLATVLVQESLQTAIERAKGGSNHGV